jgi:peptidyl-prolyl cis-trans isomerase C
MISKLCILVFLATALTSINVLGEEINPVLGKAGDAVIREADLDRILANQPSVVQKRFQEDPQQKTTLVREILTKKIIVAKARREGFDKKADIKEQLSYVFDSFITQEYLNKVVVAGVTVPEEELKKTYQDHEKEFLLPEQVKVRHILIAVDRSAKPEEREKARTKADSILQRLNKGEDFAALAGEASDDQNSSALGGELAPFTAGKTNSEEFEKAAFALKANQISNVIETSYGFHILKLIEHREKRTAPFAEVRELIYNKLKADLEQKKIQAYVEQLSKEAGFEIFGEEKQPATAGNDKKQGSGGEETTKK